MLRHMKTRKFRFSIGLLAVALLIGFSASPALTKPRYKPLFKSLFENTNLMIELGNMFRDYDRFDGMIRDCDGENSLLIRVGSEYMDVDETNEIEREALKRALLTIGAERLGKISDRIDEIRSHTKHR